VKTPQNVIWRIDGRFAEFDCPFDTALTIGKYYDEYQRLLDAAGIPFPTVPDDELYEEDLDYEGEVVPAGQARFYCGIIAREEPGSPGTAVLAKSQEATLEWLFGQDQLEFAELVLAIVELCYSPPRTNGWCGVLKIAPSTHDKRPFFCNVKMPPPPPLPPGYGIRDFIRIRAYPRTPAVRSVTIAN